MSGIKHLSRSTGAVFRFLYTNQELNLDRQFKRLLLYQLSNLRTYQDVLLQLLRILLDTKYNTPHVFRLAD